VNIEDRWMGRVTLKELDTSDSIAPPALDRAASPMQAPSLKKRSSGPGGKLGNEIMVRR
jgi:hypothetical protein